MTVSAPQTYRRLRDEAPVYYNAQYDFWALSRYDDVTAAYRDHETYSSAKGITLDMIKIADMMKDAPAQIISLDPPEHDRLRKLIGKAFTPRSIQSWHQLVSKTITETISKVDAAGFDAVSDFAALFPVEVITKMLGVPAEHRQQLRHWIDAFLTRNVGSMMPPQEGVGAMISMGQFYAELVEQRPAHPEDDMISGLIQARITDDDGAKLVGNAIVVFADHQDQWQHLHDDRGKIPAAIEELLRYDGPLQYNFRYSMREVTPHGTTIPADSPSCSSPARPIATSEPFPTPTASTSTANGPSATTSVSVTAFTVAWARHSRGWKRECRWKPRSTCCRATKSIDRDSSGSA
jgi:cytochrome P450